MNESQQIAARYQKRMRAKNKSIKIQGAVIAILVGAVVASAAVIIGLL